MALVTNLISHVLLMDLDLNVDRMNETDVRENIIAPLLKELGYKHSSSNDIITEQTLRYPKQFLGRKKKSDPQLRGKADYILEVENRLRWIAEVKSPAVEISDDDREQACTYAMHPEVKAIYYLITNGRKFEIYRTLESPSAPPIFVAYYNNIETNLQAIKNILSPVSLKRDNPEFILDIGKPLAPGFRSFAKIINGTVTYESMQPPLPGSAIIGMTNYFREGSVERSEGRLLAYLKVGSSHRQIDEFNRAFGLEIFEVYSDENELSTDPSRPTKFSAPLIWTIPKGSKLFCPPMAKEVVFPIDLRISSMTQAAGWLEGNQFRGTVSVDFKMTGFQNTFRLGGIFQAVLS